MQGIKRWVFRIAVLGFVIFAGACTPKPFLKVQYQLPVQSQTLIGQQVTLAVSDMRGKEAILTDSARKSLKNFDDTFSLVVLRDDGTGNLFGVYDLVSLLSEVFQRRLNNEGVQVAAITDNSLSELKIEIMDFQIDFSARKWIVKMNYRASLSDKGNLRSKESVSGEAERLKLRGKSDVEKILGELLTDMVNKLNLERLFQQAQK